MATIPLDCPHCGTRKSGFAVVHETQVTGTERKWLLLMCSNDECMRPVVVLFDPFNTEPKYSHDWINEIYPEAQPLNAPANTPKASEKAFLQGLSNLQMGSEFADAAGSMFRKALDRGIHEFDPELNQNLSNAIDELADSGSITETMKDWAHEIRSLGNDAAHNDFTFDQAKEMKDFTEVFLQYLFSMPAMIERRRAKARTAAEAGGN